MGEKFSEEGEEGAVLKVQQEELRDEKHGTVARCVCAGYPWHLPAHSASFQRVGCTGHKEVNMRMASPNSVFSQFLS